ncbi:flotillin family protein [Halalkalibacter alkalisediminis]|uniref:Flotillin family protein n=1 Tax=Halalkalibacter alkalisediminis TaxID=935616 RepID=A0ABV6NGE5_9BACI|nr:flotillin family protein [Halalkalibacter alkalisediminis]
MSTIWLFLSSILLFVLLIVSGIVFFIFKKRYRTASSNQALIITGPKLGNPEEDTRIFFDENGRSLKIIRGGGIRLKMFQTCTPVDLNSFQIKLTTPKVYTSQGVPVIADAVTSVKIADSLIGIANYAEQFLGKKDNEIEEEVSKVLGTNLRAILSKMTVEEINNDRESFNHQVQDIAQQELDNMGFKITSFGLDDLRDADEENGYLENLGRPRIAEIRKKAEMAESDAEKETRMYKARNNQEAQDEENKRLSAIAESRKEKDIKAAQIKEETERARAKSEQSYELEKARLAQQVKEEEMKIQYIERQRQVELELEEQKRRKALADANAYDIKANSEAEAEKARIDGETKAMIEKQKGLAEADVIRERGRAEAEAKELMAKAMEKYGEAAILEMFIDMLPKYAREVAQPLSQIEEMRVIDLGGADSNGGASKITSNVTKTMIGLQESLKESTGMDLKAMLESFVSRGQADHFKTFTSQVAAGEEGDQQEQPKHPTEFENQVAPSDTELAEEHPNDDARLKD